MSRRTQTTRHPYRDPAPMPPPRRERPSMVGPVLVFTLFALVWAIFHGAHPMNGRFKVFEWREHVR